MAEIVKGMAGLHTTFLALQVDTRDKSARRIAAAGGARLRKEVRNVITQKGLIKSRALINNVAIKREKKVPAGIEQYHIGIRHGRDLGKKAIKYLAVGASGRIVTRRQNDPYYWRFLEFGHKLVARATGRTGTVYKRGKDGKMYKAGADSITARRRSPTGLVPARPFIRPALENSKLDVLAAMEEMAKKLLLKQQ